MRTTADPGHRPSPELMAAQALLLQQRASRRAERSLAGEPERNPTLCRQQAPIADPTAVSLARRMPESGAGFESAPFTAHLRAIMQRRRPETASPRKGANTPSNADGRDHSAPWSDVCPQANGIAAGLGTLPAGHTPQPIAAGAQLESRNGAPATMLAPATTLAPPTTLALLPDLALAMLRRDQVAAGRLWLLLRLLDQPGRGWLYLQSAQQQLTSPGAPLRLCARRQLRNLLAQGEGLFWERRPQKAGGKVRIWLRSPAKVAQALGCPRITQRPVALPRAVLLGSIGQVRAHFYAAFHSARPNSEQKPISRAALRSISAVSAQTQRSYEARAGVISRVNWALGAPQARADRQQQAWQHGRALFTFTDKQGKHGPPGSRYYAWQLPNSYAGPHKTLARTQQRRNNKQLKDLAHKGKPGNVEPPTANAATANAATANAATAIAASTGPEPQRAYFADARQAAGHLETRAEANACYWPSRRPARHGTFWHPLSESEDAG